MNENYCVYVHINKSDSNKCYVGISKNPEKRWRKGEGYKGQQKFYSAIKKYGWDNFKHIILLKGLSQEEAWKKEQEYIFKYDSINDGYNVHEGGQIIITPEMRKKGYISNRLKNSSVIISSYQSDKILSFDTVKEASEKTGISEHWFYMYYRKEVDDLYGFNITFGIDPPAMTIEDMERLFYPELYKKRQIEKFKGKVEKEYLEMLEEDRKIENAKQEKLEAERKHTRAIELARKIAKNQNKNVINSIDIFKKKVNFKSK